MSRGQPFGELTLTYGGRKAHVRLGAIVLVVAPEPDDEVTAEPEGYVRPGCYVHTLMDAEGLAVVETVEQVLEMIGDN